MEYDERTKCCCSESEYLDYISKFPNLSHRAQQYRIEELKSQLEKTKMQKRELELQASQQWQYRILNEQIQQTCYNSKYYPMSINYNYGANYNTPTDMMKYLTVYAVLKNPEIEKILGITQQIENVGYIELWYDFIFPHDPIKKWAIEEERRIEKKYEYLKWM